MDYPLITVVVPIYNVADYVRASVESICQQTYENLEIILINDGSTDDSMDRIADLVAADQRIKVIQQSNQGLSAARNAGIEVATGVYITFVDSDDILYLTAIESLYEALVRHHAKIAIGSVERIQDENVLAEIIFEDKVLSLEELIYRSDSVPHNTMKITAWGKLYARDLFEDIRYPVGKIHEDEFTTYKLYLKAGEAVTTSSLVYRYVVRPESITNKPLSIQNMAALEAFREKHQILESLGMPAQDILLQYIYNVERLWRAGIVAGNKELCRQVRTNYWYGFSRLSFKKKLWKMLKYFQHAVREFWGQKRYRRWLHLKRLFTLLIKGGSFSTPLVFYSEKASLAYHLNFKAASSSIESVLLYLEQGIPMAGEEKFELAVASLTKPQQPQENYTHFSFSINPFKRLVSCYENKVVQEAHLTDRSLDIYMLGWLKRSKNFDQFVKRVTKIPPRLLEGHLAYQHPIFYKDGEKRLDFIGKVENIEEDYGKLAERHHLPPLPEKNKSSRTDWRDSYTTSLAQRVYSYYQEDIKRLGYEGDYQDLLDYLKERGE